MEFQKRIKENLELLSNDINILLIKDGLSIFEESLKLVFDKAIDHFKISSINLNIIEADNFIQASNFISSTFFPIIISDFNFKNTSCTTFFESKKGYTNLIILTADWNKRIVEKSFQLMAINCIDIKGEQVIEQLISLLNTALNNYRMKVMEMALGYFLHDLNHNNSFIIAVLHNLPKYAQNIDELLNKASAIKEQVNQINEMAHLMRKFTY